VAGQEPSRGGCHRYADDRKGEVEHRDVAQAYRGREDNDLVLWLPSINAIVTADTLSDFGDGLDVWLGGRKHVTRDDVVQRLRPLLELPVELVLPAHGEPTDRAALERALS
jgi:glyoxylase-like metal-dependent hydrolase (beta-lactamase superfamily II)